MKKQPSTIQPKERKKFVPVKFEQTFETVQEMIDALKQQGEICYDIFPDKDDKSEYTPSEAAIAVFNVFADHVPELETGKDRIWSMSISNNRVSLKTNARFAFAYTINYTFDGEAVHINSVDCNITFFGKFSKDFAENCGWKEIPVRNK